MPICTWLPIPRVQEFHLIPLFSREQECVSEAFLRLRVAHLPQKPFSYSIIHQNKNRLPFFGSLCILVISRHPGSIFARCPSANPRRSSKGFFSSVTLTLNVFPASEVKSFEPQLVSRLVAIGALRLLASRGISPHFR